MDAGNLILITVPIRNNLASDRPRFAGQQRLLASGDLEALDKFDNWFSGATWNMHQSSELQAQKFAAAIERRLAEYDSGKVSDEQLRQQLSDLLRDYSEDINLRLAATASQDPGARRK